MKVFLLILLPLVFTIGCGGKGGSSSGPPSSTNDRRSPSDPSDGSSQDPKQPEFFCHYRYVYAPEEQKWEQLRQFIGLWISKKSELGERRMEDGSIVYTRRGFNIESEISFRPVEFLYEDEEGLVLLSIDAEPDHSFKMSSETIDGFFIVQTFQDLRPKREKCATFAIQLTDLATELEVLGPELGASTSSPKPVSSFLDSNPQSETFEIYEGETITYGL